MKTSIHGSNEGLLYHIKKDFNLYLMVLPGLIWFIIFCYVPMYGIVIAFKDYSIFRGITASPWVGFKYFKQFIEDPYFFRITKNTFLLGFYTLLGQFPTPIILALSLNEVKNSYFKKFTQTISYLPHFISTVIIVGLLFTFTSDNGIFNLIATKIIGKPINFFLQPEWFRTLYVGSAVWSSIGWDSIIYLAALSGIELQLYEAATIDGANRWKQIWHISIPSIKPLIKVLLILNIGGILGVGFEKVYLMYNPAIYETADVISTYVYRWGIQDGNYGFGTAVGLFQSVASLILLVSANYISKKFSEESLW